MVERNLTAAIIGLGRMGSTFDDEIGPFSRRQPPHAHAGCYLAAGVEVVGGADLHEGQRAAFAQRWGIEPGHVYADYRELLARERPDIVSICTTARLRARILLDVVDAGVKAIWAEKPIAISLAEADTMVEACRKAGVRLAVGVTRCWDAPYTRMRQLIEIGEIGDVLQVIGLGRCTLSHNGSHLLTLVAYLAGGPRARCQWVFGHMESDQQARDDVDLAGNGYLQFENGVQAFVRSMPCGAADWEFEVIGTTGRMRAVADAQEVELWKQAPSSLDGQRRNVARHLFPLADSGPSANTHTVLDLLHCVETGDQPTANGESARQALEIAIAMRESHRRGGVRVDLPLADRSLLMQSSETLADAEPAAVRRARAAAALSA